MAGASGAKWPSRILAARLRRWLMVFALFSCSSSLRMRRGYRIGTSDMVSAPPASVRSAWPDCMSAEQSAMAALEEMHAMVTVCAGTVSGTPAASAASRAMLLVRTGGRRAQRGAGRGGHVRGRPTSFHVAARLRAPSWITVPMITLSSAPGSTAVRVSTPLTASRPRSCAM